MMNLSLPGRDQHNDGGAAEMFMSFFFFIGGAGLGAAMGFGYAMFQRQERHLSTC